ncbi:unnamed protein product [Symbiodinium sp. CCMP2592]|nr:unnamed protein product [Symbiodinium sp. CCMP2592]
MAMPFQVDLITPAGGLHKVPYEPDWTASRFKKEMVMQALGIEELKKGEHLKFSILMWLKVDMDDGTRDIRTTRYITESTKKMKNVVKGYEQLYRIGVYEKNQGPFTRHWDENESPEPVDGDTSEDEDETDESETNNSEATDANEIILEEKDEKVAGFVNVIYYLDGRRYTMHTIYYQSETFGDFAKRFPASVRDKIGDDFKFMVMQSYVENYDTLSSVLTPEFDTVTIVPVLRGGGLVKKDTLKKKHTVAIEESGFKKCYDLMLQSRSATAPKLKDILNAMKLADLKEYRTQLEHHKANNPKKVMALASFSENYALVDAMIEELTVLKKKIEENVVQSANNDCTAESGEFRMVEFKKALDIAIAVKEAMPSSAYPAPDATMNA